jgi:hypothetical protein
VPLCLLDAVRAGKSVRIEPKGARWALLEQGGSKPLAARKHRAAADELLRLAYSDFERELQIACPPRTESREALVFTPQRPAGEAVRYAVLEAADVVSSHDPLTFSADRRYPSDVQERVYDRDPNEQRKVMVGAQTLNPAVVVNRAPTPEAGPPLVTTGGRAIVLGGNGRSMMIRRAYANGEPAARAYREDLERRAGEFGLTADQVRGMKAPILVRVVEGLTAESPVRELSAAVRRYNETMTAALDERARAVAKARQLSENTIIALGELLAGAGDASLRDVMRAQPEAFLRLLEADGIVTPQNRAEWTQGGALTDRAKDELEGLFLGRVLGTSQRLSATSPATLRKVERAVPYLVRVEGLNPSFSRIATLQAAVDLANEAQNRKLSLDELLSQVGMFEQRKPDPAAEELARVLLEESQRSVADRFKRWASVASFDPRQATMFGRPPSLEEANAALFRRLSNPCGCEHRRPNPSVVCPRCKGTGRAAPWATAEGLKAFDTCPLCSGRGVLVVDQLPRASPSQPRLFNPGTPPGTELRVVVQRAGKNAGGAELWRPCLAVVDVATSKVRELYSCGETTKTALETALEAAKRLARSQNLVIDAGGVLLEPSGRTSNPGRPIAIIETTASTTRQLARELVLGYGRELAGAEVLVRRPGRAPIRIRFDGAKVPTELLVDRKPNPALRKDLAGDVADALKRDKASVWIYSGACPCKPLKKGRKALADFWERQATLARARRELAALERGPAATAALERSRPILIEELRREIPVLERRLRAEGCGCTLPGLGSAEEGSMPQPPRSTPEAKPPPARPPPVQDDELDEYDDELDNPALTPEITPRRVITSAETDDAIREGRLE